MATMLTWIKGAAYHEGAQEFIAGLKAGAGLQLVREPKNPHDRNAVAVCDRLGRKLGYVPRQDAPSVAKAMDSGMLVRATAPESGRPRIEITWERHPLEDALR